MPREGHCRPGEWWEWHLRALRLQCTSPAGPGGSPGARRPAPPPSLRLRRSRLGVSIPHAAHVARLSGRPFVQTAHRGLPADLNLFLTHRLAAPRRQSRQRSACAPTMAARMTPYSGSRCQKVMIILEWKMKMRAGKEANTGSETQRFVRKRNNSWRLHVTKCLTSRQGAVNGAAEAEAAVRRMARIRGPLRLQSKLGKWTAHAFPTRCQARPRGSGTGGSERCGPPRAKQSVNVGIPPPRSALCRHRCNSIVACTSIAA